MSNTISGLKKKEMLTTTALAVFIVFVCSVFYLEKVEDSKKYDSWNHGCTNTQTYVSGQCQEVMMYCGNVCHGYSDKCVDKCIDVYFPKQ